jgi:SagB-type dehydrogenase family enzyme
VISGVEVLYCLNPALLIYPTVVEGERCLIAEVSSSEAPVLVRDPRFVWALSLLPESFSEKEAKDLWLSQSEIAEIGAEIWDLCCDLRLLLAFDSEEVRGRWSTWQRYQWYEAYAYHESTRDYPFLKMDEADAFRRDDERMRAYVQENPPPPIYLEFPSHFQISLAKLAGSASAQNLLQMRSSDRKGLAGLSLLLDVCFGERSKKAFSVQGDFLRKSVPSGGARHPTEIFLLVFAGAPVSPGVYHYNVQKHALDLLRPGDHAEAAEHATFDLFQKFDKRPLGLLIFASLFERPMWRYREARSWRAPLIDVGHAIMAFRTVARALGYYSYTYQKVRDRELISLLGVDHVRLTPLFVATLV